MDSSSGRAEIAVLARELERLRDENARLSRLLELRGWDTTPAAEQPAMPLATPGMVTMASSLDDKLRLYADRFQARRDVYAVRWENARSGLSGWSPAVAGGWRKGADRSSIRHLPLTPDVLGAHLAGEVFIGLYPLLTTNACHFLAADFDGAVAMMDALAYAKAARSRRIPAAVEISQSGRGAHVWIMFSGPVPAVTARAIGTWLVHEAMVLRGAMDLRSYDRLFPNQDLLPAGGFGNLIAAPLQGRRRRDGLTVFLDLATLEPHADQWAYLSTLDRLDPRDAARLAKHVGPTPMGSGIAVVSVSTASKVQPRLPAVVRAELAAGLAIDMSQLTPSAVATLKHVASLANPKFYELQRLRKSTWDTPRFVRGYDVTLDDRLVLPRGLRHQVAEIVERSGSRLEVTDARRPGREIDLALGTELSEPQASAVNALLAHDDGILVAPPGAGKTVMACALIAERGTSTLVLVDRKALAEQWRTRIEQFLGIRAGQLGGGRKKLSGIVDIAMLPSLARREEIDQLTNDYGQVIVDECHHLAAAAYEHSVKPMAARFWLGLTATPKRRDGLGDLATWQLGPIRHVIGATQHPGTLLAPDVAEGGPRRELHIHDTRFAFGDVDFSDPATLAEVQRALIADEDRNDQIVADILEALGRRRNCLVLTRRVAHVDTLAKQLTSHGQRPLVLQGGMSASERRSTVAELADARPGDAIVVIGTTPFIGEGFDVPALDTLFLAGPISFDGLLVQCAGRVVRSSPGKDVAEAHDYHDVATPIVAASLRRRMPGYRALGFEVVGQ
ncbi:MAG: TOTE conflict system archaeo-eukaryotic primase domain-containing protein [Propionibacteriaceae bacterium]